MKYKAASTGKKRERDFGPLARLGGILFFVLLPFVVSFDGLDKFRLPKDVFLTLGAPLLFLLVLAADRFQWRIRWGFWESLFCAGTLYAFFHTLFVSGGSPAFWSLVYLGSFFLLFLSVKRLGEVSFQQRLWLWIGGSLGLHSILTVLQSLGLVEFMQDPAGGAVEGRLTPAGLIGEVNSGGFLFGLVILMMIYFIVRASSPRVRIAAILIALVNLVGLMFTQTITAIAGLTAGVVLWLVFHHWWVYRRQVQSRRSLVYIWIGILLLAMAAVPVALEVGVGDRAEQIVESMERRDWTTATAGRQPVFWLTWKMIQERPLLGYGLNSFASEFFHFRTDTEAGQSVNLIHQPGAFREVHNEYLQAWQELGVPGFLLLLLLFLVPLVQLARSLPQEEDPDRVYWHALLGIGWVFLMISCLAFFPLRLSVTSVYVALLAAGLRRYETAELEASDPVSWSPLGSPALRWSLVGLVGLAVILLFWRQIQLWNANQDAGVAAYILAEAARPQLPVRQRRTFADAALNDLEEVESSAHRLPEIFNLKGSALMILGRYEDASAAFSRAVQEIPSPEILTNLAAVYMARQETERAEELVRLALRYDPHYTKAQQALQFLAREGS